MFSDAIASKGLAHGASRPRFVDLMAFGKSDEGLVGNPEASRFFVFVARGAGILRTDGKRWPLLRGAACMAYRRPEIVGPVLRGWVLSIDRSWPDDHNRSLPSTWDLRLLPAGVAVRCEGFFEALEAELDRGDDRVSSSAVEALVELILLCHQRSPHPERGLESPSGGTMRRAQQLVDEIMGVIDGRYAERLSLADVAMALNRSASSLTRASRTVTGRTVLELIAERRIDESRRLLAGTVLSIGEIAAQVGYPNAGHFHRAFLRRTAMTPGAWRAEASRALGSKRS